MNSLILFGLLFHFITSVETTEVEQEIHLNQQIEEQADYWEQNTISGHFFSTEKLDTLSEKLVSKTTGLRIPNFYDSISYEEVVDYHTKKDPLLILSDYDRDSITCSGQIFGLYWLKNLGDLNGDGLDEIGLIFDYADWSNLNSCQIHSYQNEWKMIGRFGILELDLYQTEKSIDEVMDSLITRVGKNRIRVLEYDYGDRSERVIDFLPN